MNSSDKAFGRVISPEAQVQRIYLCAPLSTIRRILCDSVRNVLKDAQNAPNPIPIHEVLIVRVYNTAERYVKYRDILHCLTL